jgi:AcrR family transcriptional regulator
MQAEALDLITEKISTIDVWTRTPPGERRTRITRDELAATAMRIADQDGFDAVSMRRLAQELGVGTMSLYHYVRNKDELLSLLNDEMMGEVVLPPGTQLPEGWRDALRIIANRSRASLLRHPWILDIGVDPPIGPNSVRHFDETLQAVSSIDLPLGDRLDVASSIDEFVFGFCLMERMNEHAANEAEDDMVDYITALMETEQFPALQAIIDDIGFEAMWDVVNATFNRANRFDDHLEWLFDGIEVDLERRRRGA